MDLPRAPSGGARAQISGAFSRKIHRQTKCVGGWTLRQTAGRFALQTPLRDPPDRRGQTAAAPGEVIMPKLIRARDNRNSPIAEPGSDGVTLTYFNLLRLDAGQNQTVEVALRELLCVVLSGRVDIAAGGREFKNVGQRGDIWDGLADSVYCGSCPRITVRALRSGTEVAVVGGVCDQPFAPFRIRPSEVEVVEVGSRETHSHRRIFHILGERHADQCGRLLVSEIYTDDGCWAGYPPFKHDTEDPPEEADFEEIHHYRYRPETGFGAQFCYDGDGSAPTVAMTRHRDTFLVDRGYHPMVTSPGYQGYVLAVLAGRQRRSLLQHFEPQHRHLLEKIPGVRETRQKLR
jgi:5-deoxy-glucuronate isomerase